MNFEQAREKMVDCQVRPCDVTDHALLTALLTVPREEFVSDETRELAYLDRDVQIASGDDGDNRYMMAAAPLSMLIQLADPQPGNVVLVVGAGNGYACALFSMMALSVVGIEENEHLAEQASGDLARLGFDNVAVLQGDMSSGWEREAPYDVIFIEGSVDEVPASLLDQLSDDGRLVAVVGSGNSAQAALYQKSNGLMGIREAFNCAVPKIPGFESIKEFTF